MFKKGALSIKAEVLESVILAIPVFSSVYYF